MNLRIIARILGVLLMLFSLTQLVPAGVAWYYQDGLHTVFLMAFGFTFLSGIVAWLPNARQKGELRTRDGFLITALFWLVLSLFGAIPFVLSAAPHLAIADAIFESVSGLTTTGATVITGLDALPQSILYYRQQLQWLGGIGIVVIAVAILPMLGIGGMQLYQAETPGPVKDSKLTPRITGTAKALFSIYLLLTIACATAYWLAGMTPFDAIGHSFSTVAIGGFSTHDASMGHFDSPLIHAVAVFFMMLAGVNFALHFVSFQRRKISHYIHDPECVFYTMCMIGAVLVTCVALYAYGVYSGPEGLMQGIFQTVSIATTTGFTTDNFSTWPSFLPWMLFFFAFMGGCAGSTGGGIKVVRVMLMIKQGVREIRQLIYPRAVIPIKLGHHRVSDRVMTAVWSFFSVYVVAYLFLMMTLINVGMDFTSAFSAVGATLNNLGPGLGSVALHYQDIGASAKLILSFAMLLGRLEIFTVLVLLSPAFWRR